MSTLIYTDPTTLYSPAFKTDSDLSWDETHAFELTGHKIESKGSIKNHIAQKPWTATLSGRVTAAQPFEVTKNPQKLQQARDELVQAADKRGQVLVVAEMFTGLMGIAEASISKTAEDGKSFRISLKLEHMEFTTTASAAVPTAKLKKKLKKGMKKGGAAAKRKATAGEKAKAKTLALRIAEKLKIAPR